MSKYLYMAVTADEFELPLMVEESANELAYKLGIEPVSVYNSITNNRSGKNTGRKIVKVKKL